MKAGSETARGRTGAVRAAAPARAVISGVTPEVDCGRYAIKRITGESVVVEADVFADGHDLVAAVVLHRRAGEEAWSQAPMEPLGNDRFRGRFTVEALGRHEYTVAAWIDRFESWRRDLGKRLDAGQDPGMDLEIGARLVEEAAVRAEAAGDAADGAELRAAARAMRGATGRGRGSDDGAAAEAAMSPQLGPLMARWGDRGAVAEYGRRLPVVVDRPRARFGAWYELFPRSAGRHGVHGTFRNVIELLPYISSMGFDVLYLPPIHPIGRTKRKGRNNREQAEPGDVGSPWGIGAEEGGHTAVHPELGTLEDFDALVRAAAGHGIEIALDIAFQCSPDHPWVVQHPEWFRKRPDGTIQYAENPPKKYQDIYPLDFDCEDWRGLWQALRDVILFWAERGVRIFRVDNPHTKAMPFWEWAIAEVKREHPGAIFLSEAFTRPKVMHHLAKLGFTQSYTYFTWRNTKWELEEYFRELTSPPVREVFRPNLWPNTPDILHEFLQTGGRPAFVIRLLLAATLGASYGIYGPAFELCEARAREPGSEEYLDSEKYQLRSWDLEHPQSLRYLIARVNRIRRDNAALQRDDTLRFHRVDNDEIICYSKSTPDLSNVILCAVSLDPKNERWGWTELDMAALGLETRGDEPYEVHDLLTDARYTWRGPRNVVGLSPEAPAHILRVRGGGRWARSEAQFEYYM